MQVWGYVPDSDRDAAWATVAANRELLSGVSMFQYRLDAAGDLVEYPGLAGEPPWTQDQGLAVVPMVTNLVGQSWDREVVAAVLADPDRRRHHLEQLVALAVQPHYPGLELDYENLTANDRQPLAAFVEDLAAALHSRGKQLSLALHAKLSEPGDGAGAQAQDWSRLAQAADRIVVMTYDHDPSRPGPIAPLAWTLAVLRFALTQIPADRLLQGIPFYGYDWSAQGVEYCTYQEVMALAQTHGRQPDRDSVDQHRVLAYQRDGVDHEIWIPDGQTVAALLNVGRELGVAGYAIWRLGGEDPLAWSAIQQQTR